MLLFHFKEERCSVSEEHCTPAVSYLTRDWKWNCRGYTTIIASGTHSVCECGLSFEKLTLSIIFFVTVFSCDVLEYSYSRKNTTLVEIQMFEMVFPMP